MYKGFNLVQVKENKLFLQTPKPQKKDQDGILDTIKETQNEKSISPDKKFGGTTTPQLNHSHSVQASRQMPSIQIFENQNPFNSKSTQKIERVDQLQKCNDLKILLDFKRKKKIKKIVISQKIQHPSVVTNFEQAKHVDIEINNCTPTIASNDSFKVTHRNIGLGLQKIQFASHFISDVPATTREKKSNQLSNNDNDELLEVLSHIKKSFKDPDDPNKRLFSKRSQSQSIISVNELDPVRQEGNMISVEIEQLKLKLFREDIDLKRMIKKLAPYIGVDISKGVTIPKEKKNVKLKTIKMMKGNVQRITYQNKMHLKREAAKRKRLLDGEEGIVVEDDPEKLERRLLKKYAAAFNKYQVEYGRALRVMIDAYKDKVYQDKQEKILKQQAKTQQEKLNDLADKLEKLNDQERQQALNISSSHIKKFTKLETSIISKLFKDSQESDRFIKVSDSTRELTNKPKLLKDDIMAGLVFDQKSVEVSHGNEPMQSFLELSLSNEQELNKKFTKKAINSKKRINYLSKHTEIYKEKLDKKLHDYENYICKPPKPPGPIVEKQPEPELREGQVKPGFEHLKYFMMYLRKQYKKSLMDFSEVTTKYFAQFIAYHNNEQARIENFVQRECIKIKILQNCELGLHDSQNSRLINPDDIGDKPRPNDFLIFDNDYDRLKGSSYEAPGLKIDVLPLSQLYVFREQICKQQYCKSRVDLSLDKSSFMKHSHSDFHSSDESHRTFQTLDSKYVQTEVDYELLDEVLKSVLFFQSFGKETRLKLYKEFRYEHICQNTLIFVEENQSLLQMSQADRNQGKKEREFPLYNQDEYDNRIFVIISGHASLLAEDIEQQTKYVQRSLFPGNPIGDGPIALGIKPGVRLSFVSQTDCDILSIEKQTFKNILVKDFTMINDLKDKMKALKNQILFSEVTNYALMILTNYIEIKTFHFGDVIFSQDEQPNYFYIMLEGECKTVFETLVIKDQKQYENQQPNRGDIKNFNKKSQVNEEKFKTGPIDYKKFTKPPLFQKKSVKPVVGEGDFLGRYEMNKHLIKSKQVVQISKEVIEELCTGQQSKNKTQTLTADILTEQNIIQLATKLTTYNINDQNIQKKLTINQLKSSYSQVEKTGKLHNNSIKLQDRLILNVGEKFNSKNLLAIRQHIHYIDGRVIVSAEGDKSTFDDFDWGIDMTDKSGLGSSFCQRVLLQEEPLIKQILKFQDFYESVVGGKEKVENIFQEQQRVVVKCQIHTKIAEAMQSANKREKQMSYITAINKSLKGSLMSTESSKKSRAKSIQPNKDFKQFLSLAVKSQVAAKNLENKRRNSGSYKNSPNHLQEQLKIAFQQKTKKVEKNQESLEIDEKNEPQIKSHLIEGKGNGYRPPGDTKFKGVLPPKENTFDKPLGNQTFEETNIGHNLAQLKSIKTQVFDLKLRMKTNLQAQINKSLVKTSTPNLLSKLMPKITIEQPTQKLPILGLTNIKVELPKITSRSDKGDFEREMLEEQSPIKLTKKQTRKIQEAKSLEPFRYREDPSKELPKIVMPEMEKKPVKTNPLQDLMGKTKQKTSELTHEQIKEKKAKIIFDLLMRSQLTVVANSNTVRVIAIPKNGLDYLSEPVRRRVRQKIMELFLPPNPHSAKAEKPEAPTEEKKDEHHQEDDFMMEKEIRNDRTNTFVHPARYNFNDLVDRPFPTELDLQNFIKSNQEWTDIKDYLYKRI